MTGIHVETALGRTGCIDRLVDNAGAAGIAAPVEVPGGRATHR